MALTVSARSRFSGPSTQALIKAAAICSAVGIGASITEDADYGKWLAALGVLLLIVGLHRFGRMGPDPAIVFELEQPRKKKPKRRKALGANEAAPPASPESDDPLER
jgi:hypothetical protein